MANNNSDAFTDRLTSSKERRICMLFGKHLSDVQFLVGPAAPADAPTNEENAEQQTFHCHKMILALTSEVFDRMFNGAFPLQSPIRVDDVRPKIFQVFLEYVYTYELNSCHLSVPEFAELIYVGQMYMMKDFVDACVTELKNRDWNVEHVIPMYEVACLYGNFPLMLHSYQEIRKKSPYLLTHHTFLEMNVSYMKRFVIFISELLPFITILRALENYAQRLCRDSDDYETLVEAALNMKFHKLTQAEFTTGPAMSFLFRYRIQEIRAKRYAD